MTAAKTDAPDEDKASKTTVPDGGSSGETVAKTEAPGYKFKSQEEAEKSYQELERKYGEHSKEVAAARKVREDTDTMLRAVYADPDTYRAVEQAIRKYTTGETIPDSRKTTTTKKGDEGAPSKDVDPVIADMKKSQENKILDEFFNQYGYKNLDEAKRKDAYTRLSMSLAELVDPGGSRPIKEVLEQIPLAKLPRFLENAHLIANKDHVIKQARDSALTQQENDEATIGGFASSSGKGKSQTVILTNSERETAKKMGISEEAYAKRKGQIQTENSRYG